MTINIRSSEMELTDAIRNYIEEKFQMLDKYASDIMQVDVHVGRNTHHHKGDVFMCSATVEVTGEVLKVEREEEDLYKAIDKVKDHLRENLAQRKEKEIHERRTESSEL